MSGSSARPPPFLAARQSSAGDSSKSSHGSIDAPPPDPRPPARPKRTLIESACSACRRRKSRCDGVRPSCSRCQTLRTDCAYEAEEGESRWSALRRRNQILETERAELRELMSYVQNRPEPEAQEIFNRIRDGGYEELFNLLRQVRDGEVIPTSPSSPAGSANSNNGSEHRLPPLRVMLDVIGVPPPLGIPATSPVRQGAIMTPDASSSQSRTSMSRGSQSSSSNDPPIQVLQAGSTYPLPPVVTQPF